MYVCVLCVCVCFAGHRADRHGVAPACVHMYVCSVCVCVCCASVRVCECVCACNKCVHDRMHPRTGATA